MYVHTKNIILTRFFYVCTYQKHYFNQILLCMYCTCKKHYFNQVLLCMYIKKFNQFLLCM